MFQKVNKFSNISIVEKDYNAWNIEKQKIDNQDDVVRYPKPREIWFTKMGINIGDEQNGKEKFQRPVLIIKKIGSLYFCISLSTKSKNSFFYRKLEKATFYDKYKVEDSTLLVSQGKIFDSKRFIKQIGYVNQNEFLEIKKLLKEIYF